MKTSSTLRALALLLPLAAAGFAHAEPQNALGRWRGTGTSLAVDGTSLGDFTVEVERKAVDARTIDLRGVVTPEHGPRLELAERQVLSGTGWTSESPQGKGAGRCFGEGLCQGYVDLGGGRARTTTIVLDGPDKMRLLITELEQGRAVRFIRQTLVRQ